VHDSTFTPLKAKVRIYQPVFQKSINDIGGEMDKEFELFLRERKFVQNVSPNTIDFYEYSFKTLKKYGNVISIKQLNKTLLMP
jgi:hypothetical protein